MDNYLIEDNSDEWAELEELEDQEALEDYCVEEERCEKEYEDD